MLEHMAGKSQSPLYEAVKTSLCIYGLIIIRGVLVTCWLNTFLIWGPYATQSVAVPSYILLLLLLDHMLFLGGSIYSSSSSRGYIRRYIYKVMPITFRVWLSDYLIHFLFPIREGNIWRRKTLCRVPTYCVSWEVKTQSNAWLRPGQWYETPLQC